LFTTTYQPASGFKVWAKFAKAWKKNKKMMMMIVKLINFCTHYNCEHAEKVKKIG
jgi:hypothetical protein